MERKNLVPATVGRSSPATLSSVAWFDDDDVWAGGCCGDDWKNVVHWDGTRWHRMRLHAPNSPVNWATDLSGSSSDDVWAIAYAVDPNLYPVLEHWDGSRWRSWPFHRQGVDSRLYGLTATYPDFTWAVGDDEDTTHPRALLLHWTGHKWVNEARR